MPPTPMAVALATVMEPVPDLPVPDVPVPGVTATVNHLRTR
jgi:hypothetical protein